MFFADCGRTQEPHPSSPYLRLPAATRFKICQALIADHHTDMPIALTGCQHTREVWRCEEFTLLASALEPLQSYLYTSFALRADVMVTFLMTERFHVTFSPFVGSSLDPLATRWYNRYGHFMQGIVVELDMTRFGFGPGKQAYKLRAGTVNLDRLISMFVETQLRRKGRSSLKSLVLLCRRFYGQRPSPTVVDPDLGGEAEPTKSEKAIVVYGAVDSIPYCPDDFLRVCEPFVLLEGLIDSMRLCGFNNGYTHSLLRRIFPIPKDRDILKHHSYRVAPSSVWPRIPGQSSWIDTGHGRIKLDDHSREYLHGLYFPEGAIVLSRPFADPWTGLVSISPSSLYKGGASEDSNKHECSDSRTKVVGEINEMGACDMESLEQRVQGIVHKIRRSMSKRETNAHVKTSDWASLTTPRNSDGSWSQDQSSSRATI
ncbi:hypothetical protein EsH8_VII_000228 [Colletotrichum jinshuiense]